MKATPSVEEDAQGHASPLHRPAQISQGGTCSSSLQAGQHAVTDAEPQGSRVHRHLFLADALVSLLEVPALRKPLR